MQYEDFIALSLPTYTFLDLVVFNDMSQLRENSSTSLGYTTGLPLRDLPYRDITIIVTAKKEFRVVFLPDAAKYARDCLSMALVFVTFEENRAVNLQVPQANRALFVPCGDKATVLQESHTAEL